MSYDELLSEALDQIAAEVGQTGLEFDRLEYRVRIDSPTATTHALVLWQDGVKNTEERLGDSWWGLTLSRKLRALQAASVAEGRGDFNALTLTLFPDGTFDLDFAYPEPTGA